MNDQITRYLQKNDLQLIEPFEVLWGAWDCDAEWYLCSHKDGYNVLVATNHGTPFIGTAEDLAYRIESYQHVLNKTQKVLSALNTDQK